MKRIIVSGGIRYRKEDAARLGLIADGKVVTRQSKRVPEVPAESAVSAISGADHPEELEGEEAESTEGMPPKSGTKDSWISYALDNGYSETDLEGLKRDEIAALFIEN